MALNATLGASDANSYATSEEADLYFADRMHSSSWEALTKATKDQLMVTSSRMLDWHVKWKGIKTDTVQAMQHPREGMIRPDGTEVGSGVLAPEVKIATYELAFMNISSDRLADDPLAGIGQLEMSTLMIKAGPEKPNQTNAKPVPKHIYAILSDLYVQGRGSVVRLLRA